MIGGRFCLLPAVLLVIGAKESFGQRWEYLATDPRVEPRASLDGCVKPVVVVGVLRATGDLQFTVDRRGRVDTNSINLLSANGATPEGFVSAARRYLVTCRFRPAQVAGTRAATLILARLILDRDSMILMTSRDPADSLLPVVRFASVSSEPGRVFENADEALDEKPRLLPCGRNRGTFTLPRDEALVEMMTGSAEVEFVILPNGRADRSTARVLQAESSMAGREMLSSYLSCRYAPGRVRGEPVAVRFRVR
jgi:hypothetical protein